MVRGDEQIVCIVPAHTQWQVYKVHLCPFLAFWTPTLTHQGTDSHFDEFSEFSEKYM